MGSMNFGRAYRLIVGRPDKTLSYDLYSSPIKPNYIVDGANGQDTSQSSPAPNVNVYYDTIPAKYVEITDLQLVASIGQTKDSGYPSKITIYNLSDDIINDFREDDIVILRAGYETTNGDFIETSVGLGQEELPDIFVGQIVQCVTSFPEQEKITTILCGESLTAKRNSKVSKSYPPNTTRKQVLFDMLEMLKTQGVPTGSVLLPAIGTAERTRLDKELFIGYTAKGMLFNQLQDLCNSCSLQMFTAIGKVYIEPISETTPASTAVPYPTTPSVTTRNKLSAHVVEIGPNQVKGRVEPVVDKAGKMSNAAGKKGVASYNVTTWLDGQITVASIIRMRGFGDVSGQEVDGDYKVISVLHKLDWRSTRTWDTKLVIEAL